MMLVDTHCHLDFPEFNQDRKEVIERAREAGVAYIVNIGSSVEGSRRSAQLAREHPFIYAAVGVHPHYAEDVGGKIPEELRGLVEQDKVAAIGEVGLDYYRNLSPKELQKGLFLDFIKLAKERNLPVVIHTREAHKDTMDILKKEFKGDIKGVMHCFSADEDYLKECLDMGLYISFTCNLTFKNSKGLRAVAEKVPVERLLLETDAPFLAPQQFRGRRNEPAYLTYLAEEHAGIHGLSQDDIARITTHNAKTLFGLPLKEEPRIAYAIRDSLYLNITSRCTNDCDFCTRNKGDFVKGHNLRLETEPGVEDIMKAIKDPKNFKEIVFCGYGEPLLRLDVIKKVAGILKQKGAHIRIVTNGEGNLIHKRSIAKELAGFIDKVSVSLNVDTKEAYDRICRSAFGPDVFDKIKEFARECKDAGIEVELTFLDIDGVDLAKCEKIAENEIGVNFRIRKYNIVG